MGFLKNIEDSWNDLEDLDREILKNAVSPIIAIFVSVMAVVTLPDLIPSYALTENIFEVTLALAFGIILHAWNTSEYFRKYYELRRENNEDDE